MLAPLISHVFGLPKRENFSSTVGHGNGVEWRRGGNLLVGKWSERIFKTFFLSNSPFADIISNHGIYDNGWIVQQLVPRQTEKP